MTDAVSESGHYALFSGGYDSLVATYKTMREGWTDAVLHIDTNTGIPDNREFVVRACRHFGWPLRIQQAPMTLLEFGKKFQFPGSAAHEWAYSYLKERALRDVAGLHEGKPHFWTGVRRFESNRRMRTVTEETEEKDQWWWHAPIRNFTKEDVREFRESHSLPYNPVWEEIHRSGECFCGAYANRNEELALLEAHFPDHYEWLRGVERDVQEYWGRLDVFRSRWPREWERLLEVRGSVSPRPDKLELLGWLYPARQSYVKSLGAAEARRVGMEDPRNWWGHDAMPSTELRALLAEHNESQMTLCAGCFKS